MHGNQNPGKVLREKRKSFKERALRKIRRRRSLHGRVRKQKEEKKERVGV